MHSAAPRLLLQERGSASAASDCWLDPRERERERERSSRLLSSLSHSRLLKEEAAAAAVAAASASASAEAVAAASASAPCVCSSSSRRCISSRETDLAGRQAGRQEGGRKRLVGGSVSLAPASTQSAHTQLPSLPCSLLGFSRSGWQALVGYRERVSERPPRIGSSGRSSSGAAAEGADARRLPLLLSTLPPLHTCSHRLPLSLSLTQKHATKKQEQQPSDSLSLFPSPPSPSLSPSSS